MRLVFLLCGLIVLVGPARHSSPPAGEPAEAVARFFAAIAAGDCDAALARLGTPYRAKVAAAGCAEFLQEMRRFPLEHVVEVTPDGRNRAAHLVRSQLRGRHSAILIRVQAEDGQWKIFSL